MQNSKPIIQMKTIEMFLSKYSENIFDGLVSLVHSRHLCSEFRGEGLCKRPGRRAYCRRYSEDF